MAISTVFDKPGQFWKGNLHTHSTNSDGKRSPEEVCRVYRECGYDFISLTDHFLPDFNWPVTNTMPFRTPTFTTIIGAELHTQKMEHGNVWHILADGLPLDFAPTRADESGSELARRALDAGAFVVAAHPQWHGMTENDMLALGAVHGVEIFNGSCVDDNDTTDSVYMLDHMLARGKRMTALATDDAHFNPAVRDAMRGWAMVKSATLSTEALLTALKAGDFYSTTGPLLHDVQVEPGKQISVRCSPAARIFAIGLPPESKSVSGHCLVEGEISLEKWKSPYVRILVRDDFGQRAWSNPIWFD